MVLCPQKSKNAGFGLPHVVVPAKVEKVIANYGNVSRRLAKSSIRTVIFGTSTKKCSLRKHINPLVRRVIRHVERGNNTLRQRLARFVRKTLSFPKSDDSHEIALKLYIFYNTEWCPISQCVTSTTF